MKIALLGIGTVGRGVLEQLKGCQDISVKKVLVRRAIPELGALATSNYNEILSDPEITTVVEVMGGMDPAYAYVMQALKAGKHVVTANKLMLSYHMKALLQTAQQNHVELKFDASVGGGIPYLHNLRRTSTVDSIQSLFGIVNGTTNLILDTMQTINANFDDVLVQAQRAGYAEADPSADIDGIDSRSKLTVSCAIAFQRYLNPDEINVAGIRSITSDDVLQFKKLGYICRLLVRAERITDDRICAFVEPTLVRPSDPVASVHRNDNLIGLVGNYCGQQYFFGQGAGKNPTAFAIMLGLREIANQYDCRCKAYPTESATVDNSQLIHRYYVRTTSRLSIPAEKLRNKSDENVYLTSPLAVDRMHALASTLRMRDPNMFFAGIWG